MLPRWIPSSSSSSSSPRSSSFSSFLLLASGVLVVAACCWTGGQGLLGPRELAANDNRFPTHTTSSAYVFSYPFIRKSPTPGTQVVKVITVAAPAQPSDSQEDSSPPEGQEPTATEDSSSSASSPLPVAVEQDAVYQVPWTAIRAYRTVPLAQEAARQAVKFLSQSPEVVVQAPQTRTHWWQRWQETTPRPLQNPKWAMNMAIKVAHRAKSSYSQPIRNTTKPEEKKVDEKLKPRSKIIIKLPASPPPLPSQQQFQAYGPLPLPIQGAPAGEVPAFLAAPSPVPEERSWDVRSYEKQRSLMRLLKKKYAMEVLPAGYGMQMPREGVASYVQVPEEERIIAMPQAGQRSFIEMPQEGQEQFLQVPQPGNLVQEPLQQIPDFVPIRQRPTFPQDRGDQPVFYRSWENSQEGDGRLYDDGGNVWRVARPGDSLSFTRGSKGLRRGRMFVQGASQAAVLADLLNRA